MNERRTVIVAIGCAVTAVLVRLIPLHWLHPVNWDETEFFVATRWIAQGKLPFRDFWEHHTPLPWFLFAPVARMIDSIDTSAIVAMRWAQLPVWIGAFALALLFMRNAGLSWFARWAAIAITVSSSLFMTSAIEFRVEPVAVALFLGALVAWQRATPRSLFWCGALLVLTGMANLRLGPVLALAIVLLCLVRRREQRWRLDLDARWLIGGALATGLAIGLWFVATSSWRPMWRQVFTENYIGERTAPGVDAAFLNRSMIVFGVHVNIFDREYDLATVDPGGIVILLGGLTGLILAFRKWRAPDDLLVLALLQIVNVAFLMRMKYVYNYHFQIAAMMMLPLLALAFERLQRTRVVLGLLVVAWCVNIYASVLRGKEDDRAYQDVIMREAHARTKPGETVFAGIPWALQREPAYHFWFLPELARQLVKHGHARPYALREVLANPPAALVSDRNAIVWLAQIQRELGPYFIRHYTPVWRSLWIPGMNALLQPGAEQRWLVPRDGEYRLYASAELSRHPWFRRPMYITAFDLPGVELRLPPPGGPGTLQWFVDERPRTLAGIVVLKKGQRIRVRSTDARPLGVFLVNSDDPVIFRQPPAGVTLEAASPRVTHWPVFR